MKKLIYLAIPIAFFAFTATASANLVTNGDFEAPVVGAPQLWDVFVGPVSGWNVEWMPGSGGDTDPKLELHRGVAGWLSQGGSLQHAELDTDWDGPGGVSGNEASSVKISQEITTENQCTYTLKFWFSPRPGTGLAQNALGVMWNGSDVTPTISADGTSNNNTLWTEYTFSVLANGSISTLAFEDRGRADSLGTFLDTVSLELESCPPPPPPQGCDCGDVKVKNKNFSFISNRVSSRADTGDNSAGGADGGNGGNSGAINNNDGGDVENSSTGNGGNGGAAGVGSGGTVITGNAYSRAKTINVVNTNFTRVRTRAPQ